MADRIQIQCPGCSAKLAISDESKLGKKIRCSKCSEVFVAKALKASGSAATKPKPKPKKSDDDEFNFDDMEMEDKSEIEGEESEAESRPLKAKSSKAKIGAKGKGKRKSGGNMPLIIGGSVAVVLLLGVGSYFLFRGKEEPAAVAAPVAQQPVTPVSVAPAGGSPIASNLGGEPQAAPSGSPTPAVTPPTTQNTTSPPLDFAKIVTNGQAANKLPVKNQFKQIGLAFRGYHETHKSFPPAFHVDSSGKPLLSWRVQLLPFLEQAELYKEFHLDEPWDSEHNKTLIARMPPVFGSPENPELTAEGKTRFLVPRGPGFAFEGNAGFTLRDFTDGIQFSAIAFEVESASAVVWTKPEDLVVDLQQPFKNLKIARTGGFFSLFADGSVHFVHDAVPTETLIAILTRNGKDISAIESGGKWIEP